MISSEQALEIILQSTEDFGVEEIPFIDSLGRVLKEDILADRDFPPFNRVSMDGIAINFSSFQDNGRNFKIEGIQAAGTTQLTLKNNDNCFEVMTGAMLPKNTDTVIRYEDVTIDNDIVTIDIDTIIEGQNVHVKGKDRNKDDVLIRKNTVISSAEIGVLATVGKSIIKVGKQPKVIIISTGDELVDVVEIPLNHQIRKSNVHTLVALLKKLNIKTSIDHIQDNKEKLKERIAKHLNDYDVLLFSGAVSKGKFDFLPVVLEELGVQKLFHKVAQRPGKPFWYGKKERTTIFAFPGNPVSTYIGCLKYFYPWYKNALQIPYDNFGKAVLGEDFIFKPELTYFLQVKIENKKGLLIALPIQGNGSGDLANLVEVDGFLELPSDKKKFKTGEAFPLILFRE